MAVLSSFDYKASRITPPLRRFQAQVQVLHTSLVSALGEGKERSATQFPWRWYIDDDIDDDDDEEDDDGSGDDADNKKELKKKTHKKQHQITTPSKTTS